MPNVTKAEFRTLVFEFARAKQLRVDEIKDGKARIWFNENSQKFEPVRIFVGEAVEQQVIHAPA